MCAERACDLPDAEPEHFLYIVRSRSLGEGIGADPVIAVGGQNQPAGMYLSDLLPERHPPQQIRDTLRNR